LIDENEWRGGTKVGKLCNWEGHFGPFIMAKKGANWAQTLPFWRSHKREIEFGFALFD